MQTDRIDRADLYVGLVHYPVYDRRGRIICTAVTNLDVHDFARCARTFGIRSAYIVNPLGSQRDLVKRIIHHWTEGAGAQHNPTRKDALARLRVRATLEEVTREISQDHRQRVRTIATAASRRTGTLSYREMHRLLYTLHGPYLLLFGTGWGLAREVVEESDYVLAPIEGVVDYNHLSVRSAAAIILDRLMGNRWRGGSESWILSSS